MEQLKDRTMLADDDLADEERVELDSASETADMVSAAAAFNSWRDVDGQVGESAEQLHRQFLKHVLGVRGNTATPIVLAEFCRYLLVVRFHWWQQILRYHNCTNNLSDDDHVIKCAFVEGLHELEP